MILNKMNATICRLIKYHGQSPKTRGLSVGYQIVTGLGVFDA